MPEPREINEDEKEILIEYYVQKVSGRLRQLVSPNEKDKKRWIWELLQNAKDSVSHSENPKVDVLLEIHSDKIIFRHNGNSFTPKALNSLIWQKSGDKRGNSESTGRFGTGFLTTHTLSQNVKLKSGLIESDGNEWTVELTLFREGDRDEELKEGIQKTLESRTWVNEKIELTSFTYFLKNDVNKESAKAGIESLRTNIFYNLAFTPEINSISITEGNEKTVYERNGKPTDENDVTVIPFKKTNTSEDNHISIVLSDYNIANESLTKKFKSERNLRVSGAIAIDTKTNSIIPIEKQTPFLFCLFPLIGTEEFYFPVILNSRDFEPTPERDSILLLGSDYDSETELITNSGINRLILKEGVELYKRILNYVAEKSISDSHYLAKSEIPDGIDFKWFQENIQQEIRKEILNTKLVVPAIGKENIKPCEALFPIHSKEKHKEFWTLCKEIIGTKIPRQADSEIWQAIVKADKKNWNGLELKFELEDLLKKIQDEETLSKFQDKYFTGEEAKALDYLSRVIQFTEQEDKDLLTDEKKPRNIFPNQNGDFTYKERLSKDTGIPEEIKDIFNTIDEDCRDYLVRTELNEVFVSKEELKLKELSDLIKDRIEKLLSNKIKEDKKPKLLNGLFQLVQLSDAPTSTLHEQLFGFVKQVFPERSLDKVTEIKNATSFDWSSCFHWAATAVLQKLTASDLNTLSNLLWKNDYPSGKEKYSEEEESIQFQTDKFLNSLIQFAQTFENNKFHLLEDYAIIPNQLNQFCKFNSDLFNDVYDKSDYDECERTNKRIPPELKNLFEDLGSNCRKNLLHLGVTIKLNDSHDLGWICSELDKLVMNNQDSENPKIKQAIRELDRWLQKEIEKEEQREKLFLGFYPKRHKVVYQTFTPEERANLDEIAKSGQSAEFAQLVKSGAEIETVKQIAELSKEMNLETALAILKQHPQLTNEKIEQLLELEELSKGWNPDLDYDPDDEQIRINFENGWKGEAFVYKEMQKINFEVEWENKSSTETRNVITDFEGEKHFIDDKKSKYDLVIKSPSGSKSFIQVKATTTDIGRADQIALPISTREWRFIHETSQNESYYLARVFNVNGNPELYLMKLETSEDLK